MPAKKPVPVKKPVPAKKPVPVKSMRRIKKRTSKQLAQDILGKQLTRI